MAIKRIVSPVLWLTFLTAAFADVSHAAEIRSGLENKCLDVQGGGAEDLTPVVIFQCTGGDNQEWAIVPPGEIRGIGDKCLDVKGGSSDDGTPIILFRCTGGENQKWTVIDGEIRGIGGKCLDVQGGRATDRTPLILWPCHGGKGQKWVIE